jgi:methionine-rich copper-binding protein CopC
MSRFLRAFPVAGLIMLAAASQAFAHAHLKASTPADKASAAAPAEINLGFTEALDLKFSGIAVVGADKTDVALGDAVLKDDGKSLAAPVSARLAPGAYTVNWHVLSVDGHKTNGSFTFTVTP